MLPDYPETLSFPPVAASRRRTFAERELDPHYMVHWACFLPSAVAVSNG